LSTVVTTLIILVVSVLLAGVVTYFAINVTSTRVQEENLNMMHQHIWANSTDTLAAIMITNTGGRDVVLDKVAIRGQTSLWTHAYFYIPTVTVTNDLLYSNAVARATNASVSVAVGGTVYTFAQASNNLVLPSGKTLLLYINSPDSISVNDIGLTVAITVFSSQAIYYKETNIEAI